MAAWAEQGYVIILPNITGSTGFGRAFSQGMKQHPLNST